MFLSEVTLCGGNGVVAEVTRLQTVTSERLNSREFTYSIRTNYEYY